MGLCWCFPNSGTKCDQNKANSKYVGSAWLGEVLMKFSDLFDLKISSPAVWGYKVWKCGDLHKCVISGILELWLKGDELDRRLRTGNVSCKKEGGLGRGEFMYKDGRCRMWNENTDWIGTCVWNGEKFWVQALSYCLYPSYELELWKE